MSAQIIQGNALALPLPDDSVDLIVTSPPYFGLRAYQDNGETYAGQIGAEPTPAEFVDALIAATAEMVRVTKPSGSIWVNLGDKYSGAQAQNFGGASRAGTSAKVWAQTNPKNTGIPTKSLIGIPWRYAIRCIDDLGLILRAEVIWAKPNGLPESVTDRVRRSHEVWFHFVLNPRYYSAVDEIREPTQERLGAMSWAERKAAGEPPRRGEQGANDATVNGMVPNPLGKLPGSVWVIPTEPLRVPDHLGIDHFAAFPTTLPRRIITGWSPAGVCVECGEGRRPASERTGGNAAKPLHLRAFTGREDPGNAPKRDDRCGSPLTVITGYSCACPESTALTTPGVVCDPFGGTGTTALVATILGRHGISVDMSSDYCRLATWRTTDPAQLAKAARKPYVPPREQVDGQGSLLDLIGDVS